MAGEVDAAVDPNLEEELTPAQARQRDPDSSWATRPGPSVFGYKDHVVAAVKNRFIWASGVTPANVHDRQVALGLLEKVPIPTAVYADRGTAGNRRRRNERKPTTRSRMRVRVEHVFAAIKHDRGCRLHRGVQQASPRLLGGKIGLLTAG